MLLSAVSVLVVAQSSSEIPKELMNNPVYLRPDGRAYNPDCHNTAITWRSYFPVWHLICGSVECIFIETHKYVRNTLKEHTDKNTWQNSYTITNKSTERPQFDTGKNFPWRRIGGVEFELHFSFYVLLTVHLSIFLGNDQLGTPLWSSGQSFWLQIQRSRVRLPALPDFLSSSGSGTGST